MRKVFFESYVHNFYCASQKSKFENYLKEIKLGSASLKPGSFVSHTEKFSSEYSDGLC